MKPELPFFNTKQRRAVMLLLILVCALQCVLFFLRTRKEDFSKYIEPADSLVLKELDSLKELALQKKGIQPFNPNYINDAKGFMLGMTTKEIDRLLEFRSSGNYVNSTEDFQKVTGVSDELLLKISPFFKFPEWTQKKRATGYKDEPHVTKKTDLNKVNLEELMEIKGIGTYTAHLILDEREKLGGFVSVYQLDFIRGLRPETVRALKQSVHIKTPLQIKKVNVNTATKEELAKVPYIGNYLAREIILFRSKQEKFMKIEDLEKINNFPLDKLKIIRLYLDF